MGAHFYCITIGSTFHFSRSMGSPGQTVLCHAKVAILSGSRTYLTILESANSATSEAGGRCHSKITTESEKRNLRVWLL
jgi:hypothetical protein